MTDSPTPAGLPAEITHLVRERMEARARRDWPRADALKAQIEAAGWRVVDHGYRTSVGPAAPLSLEVDGEMRYGSAAHVPSLLDDPATTAWTVAVLAAEEPARLSRLLAGLRAHAPAGTRVVVVANDPSDQQAAALLPDGPDRAPIGGVVPEVLRTSARLGCAAALNIALRRATGELVLLADGTAWPVGDALTPLAAALRDPAVAAAGGFGLYAASPGPLHPSTLGRQPATAGATADATALEGAWLAFRRSDYRELGPLDERFVTVAWLDLWWTLRLRAGVEPEGAEPEGSEPEGSQPIGPAVTDAPETADSPAARSIEREATHAPEAADTPSGGEPGGEPEPEAATLDAPAAEPEIRPPRRAVRLALPLDRDEVPWPPDRSRLNRRSMYRVLDRFGWRDDLA